MKISKVFAGMSAMALAATMSITAFAGSGTIASAPDGWIVNGGNAKRIFIGQDTDTPMFTRADQSKMATITTAKVTIKLDSTDYEGVSGSFVVCATNNGGWEQHDWATGVSALDNEGNAKSGVNENGVSATQESDTVVITFTNDAGLFNQEDATSDSNYYGIAIQNFGGVIGGDEVEPAWEVEGLELLDASGNAVEPGAAGGTTTTTTAASDDTTTTTTTTTTAATTTKKSGTSTTTSTAASDNTAATGATAGIALAGLAIAGAAVVISKKK